MVSTKRLFMMVKLWVFVSEREKNKWNIGVGKILHPANITKYVLLQFRQYVEHFLRCDVRILIFDGWLTKFGTSIRIVTGQFDANL